MGFAGIPYATTAFGGKGGSFNSHNTGYSSNGNGDHDGNIKVLEEPYPDFVATTNGGNGGNDNSNSFNFRSCSNGGDGGNVVSQYGKVIEHADGGDAGNGNIDNDFCGTNVAKEVLYWDQVVRLKEAMAD